MKDRQEEVARWARQMGVPESALEQFLRERSSLPKGAPTDTLKQATDEKSSTEERELALLEAKRLNELGRLEFEASRFDEALECFQDAIAHFQGHGNRAGEGVALRGIGSIYRAKGEYDQAIAHFYESLGITRETGDKRGEGINLGNLGIVYQTVGQIAQAIAHYTQALAIAREIGDRRNEGTHLGSLGIVYKEQGQYDQAIANYTQSIAIAREIGEKRNEGIHLGNMGDVLLKLHRFNEAEAAFRDAIPLCEQTMPAAAGAFRGSLALILAQRGKNDEAFTMLEFGETPVQAIPEEHAKFLCKKGKVRQLSGDTAAAQAALKHAKEIAADLKVSDDSEVGQAIAELSRFLKLSSDSDEL